MVLDLLKLFSKINTKINTKLEGDGLKLKIEVEDYDIEVFIKRRDVKHG